MAPAFIPVGSQPLQSPLHFKLHVLSREGVPCHRQVAHGFRGHLHNHRVTGGQQITQVVGEAADSGGIASLYSDQAHWNKATCMLNLQKRQYTKSVEHYQFSIHNYKVVQTAIIYFMRQIFTVLA